MLAKRGKIYRLYQGTEDLNVKQRLLDQYTQTFKNPILNIKLCC